MEVVIGIIVIAAVIGISSGVMKQRALERARMAYLATLGQLKEAPTNADVKQCTLAHARTYSLLTRDKKGVSLFDEVALMNDINAACAAAEVAPIQPPPAVVTAALRSKPS